MEYLDFVVGIIPISLSNQRPRKTLRFLTDENKNTSCRSSRRVRECFTWPCYIEYPVIKALSITMNKIGSLHFQDWHLKYLCTKVLV